MRACDAGCCCGTVCWAGAHSWDRAVLCCTIPFHTCFLRPLLLIAVHWRWSTNTSRIARAAQFALFLIIYSRSIPKGFLCAAMQGNRNSALHFHTKSGVLTVQRTAAPGTSAASDAGSITASDGPARQCLLEMALPLVPPVDGVPLGCNTDALRRAVLAGSGLLASAAPIKSLHFAAGGGMNYALMVLDDAVSQAQLEGLHPDAAALRDAAPDGCVQGLVVTCRGDNPRYDFLSRFFGPWMGIDEDPVTGSAHCVLGPFWAGVHGRNELMARQCSRRGGDLALRLDEGAGRVVLSGPAVIVMQGTLNM